MLLLSLNRAGTQHYGFELFYSARLNLPLTALLANAPW